MGMSEAQFREAFEQIGIAAGKAAQLPDHRERPHESPSASAESSGGEVAVTVRDGKIELLSIDEAWMQSQRASTVSDLIQRVHAEAYDKWAALELQEMMQHTPEAKELYGAIAGARSQLGEAWASRVAETRS